MSGIHLSYAVVEPIIEQTATAIALRTREGDTLNFKKLPQGVSTALADIAHGGASEQTLHATYLTNPLALLMYSQIKQVLAHRKLLVYTLQSADYRFATLKPLARRFRLKSNVIKADHYYSLSRFACCRNEGGQMVIDSPKGYAQLILHDARAMTIVAQLAQPHRHDELVQMNMGLVSETICHFLELLHNANALVETTERDQQPEIDDPVIGQWEFHDMLFHSRTRQGRHSQPYGGTYRFSGKHTAPPVVKPPMSDTPIDLPKPDMIHLLKHDQPFTAVLDSRKSIRKLADTPLTKSALGEFLYRAARVKQTFTGAHDVDLSLRAYPAGGAAYELEIYPVVSQCEGLPPAIYHYDPLNHQLHRVVEKNKHVDSLLFSAWVTSARESKPQIYLAITARFQRVQFKYQSLAYALVLKDVGVLYQTMYLVATAMGLAPCALGGGDSDLFADATGINYYEESLVGEFLLGRKEGA